MSPTQWISDALDALEPDYPLTDWLEVEALEAAERRYESEPFDG